MIQDANKIISYAFERVLPEESVKRALDKYQIDKDICVISIGKAAWRMAKAARDVLGEKIKQGLVITKYGHILGDINSFKMIESGHPIPDDNSLKAAEMLFSLIDSLEKDMEVIILLSGGGSALLEMPEKNLTLVDIQSCTDKLLKCGANIREINTIRKRLSALKGGKLAIKLKDFRIFQVVLSDVVGDDLGIIASGPAYPDYTNCEEAMNIVRKYNLEFSEQVQECLMVETPKVISNVETIVTGNVKNLCLAASQKARELGYHTYILTTNLDCEAKEAGRMLASIAKSLHEENSLLNFQLPCAIIAGGETVVQVHGKGKGGRNQELALSAACEIVDMVDTLLFSVSSDGTDGPTDAAGGIVTGLTYRKLLENGLNPLEYLNNNDSYNALYDADGLIITGPTGTNVNDLSVLLCR